MAAESGVVATITATVIPTRNIMKYQQKSGSKCKEKVLLFMVKIVKNIKTVGVGSTTTCYNNENCCCNGKLKRNMLKAKYNVYYRLGSD